MPRKAITPAPVSAPAMRAESCVMRWTLIAPINWACGTVSPTSAVRMPMSDGRTIPISAAMPSTA